MKCPVIGLVGILFDHLLMVLANDLPLLAAVDTLLKISHALFNVASQHVIFVDLNSTLLDDLVADLG
jgi:hypothetical protein